MSFKTEILKLSVLIALILVLIPVVAAENSTETFFCEYDVADDEVIIQEYDFTEPSSQDDTQTRSEVHDVDVSDNNEIDDKINIVNESAVKMNDDYILAEKDNSALEKPDFIAEFESNVTEGFTCSDFEEIDDDVNETSNDGLTYDEISINQDSCSILVLNYEMIFKIKILLDDLQYYTAASYKSSNLGKITIKNLENEDVFLNGNWTVRYYTNLNGYAIINLEEDFNNRHIDDFAYSIDNSIIGDESSFILYAIFDNFTPFDTFNNNEFFINDLKLHEFLYVFSYYPGKISGFNRILTDDFSEFVSGFVEFSIFDGIFVDEFLYCNLSDKFSISGVVEFIYLIVF